MSDVNQVNSGATIIDSIVDPLTKSGRVVLESHSRIHQGNSYSAGSFAEAAADDAVLNTLIKVGLKPLHFIGVASAGGGASAQLFEGTVVDDEVIITDSGGTFTAGSIVVNVNGTDVTETFATDKATTMTALAASIQALSSVLTAVYAGGGNTITINPIAGGDLEITVDVSGITGTMTISSISGGTHLTIFNHLASSANLSGSIVKTAPVITTDGTAYPPRWFSGPDELKSLVEWVLSASTNYLFRVKNLNGDAQTLASVVKFYTES